MQKASRCPKWCATGPTLAVLASCYPDIAQHLRSSSICLLNIGSQKGDVPLSLMTIGHSGKVSRIVAHGLVWVEIVYWQTQQKKKSHLTLVVFSAASCKEEC